MQDGRRGATIIWPLVLAAAAIAGSLATACMMPAVALATVAAATMGRGPGVVAVLGAWAANQLLGFGLLGYPWTADAAGWGLAIGGAGLAALFAARAVLGRGATLARVVPAFVAAFAAYELALLAVAAVAGGLATFAPAIVARIFLNDALWLGALGIVAFVLHRAAPRLVGAVPQPQRG